MKLLTTILISFILLNVGAQINHVPLWETNKVPNSTKKMGQEHYPERNILWIENVQTPTIEIFIPSKQSANGAAVLICPGGGYFGIAYDWEGTDIAKWFNSIGMAAFVLKYRIPQAESVKVSHLAPLQDGQRAMRWIKHHATQFNIDANKVGVIGFSAGGHLASTIGTQYNNHVYKATDSIDMQSAKPNFMMLIYPVISMSDSITHKGSKNNLLGSEPNDELCQQFSSELQVNTQTPPTFLIHSGNDKVVPVENSLRMYKALHKNAINTTMHIYPTGGHGYGLGLCRKKAPYWVDVANEWLQSIK